MKKNESRNRILLVSIVVILLIIVFVIGIVIAIKYKDKHSEKSYVFNQVYYSEYKLDMIDENYYVGYLKDQQVNVIINDEGKEVFSNGVNIYYDGIYKTKEDNYIIYSNRDDSLVVYLFDGTNLTKIKEIQDVSYAKPILYTNGNIEYIVGFASQDGTNLYLYMLNGLETIVVNNVSLIGDDSVQGVYYTYGNDSLVVVNNEMLYGVIDYTGKVIVDFKYTDIINTYDNTFIVKNDKDNYGILNRNNEFILKDKYRAIDLYSNYYLVVDSDNNMAVYDTEYNNITGFKMKYNSLLEYDLRSNANSIYLWKVGNNIVVVNNYLQDLNKTEYGKGSAYFIRNGKIDEEVNEIGFANNGVVYSYDKNYNITIYDSNLEVTNTFKIDDVSKILNISKITDNIIRIKYFNNNEEEITKYYTDGKEIDYDYGDVLGKYDDSYVILKDNVVSLYDSNLVKLKDLTGDYIKYDNGYLIVDNGIYKIEKK